MPVEHLTITFYEILADGYYKPKSRHTDKNRIFPKTNTSSILSSLLTWSGNKSYVATQTYAATDSILPTYLVSVTQNKKQFLVTTWNQTPTINGALAYIDGTSKVGVPAISHSTPPAGNIPGYPTYFWFIPDEQLYATIQLPESLNGRENLHRYISSFMEKFHPEHVVSNKNLGVDDDAHLYIQGYRENSSSKIHLRDDVTILFKGGLHKNPGDFDYIKKNLSKVNRIIRKETLSSKTPNNQIGAKLKNAFSYIGLSDPALPIDHNYRVKMELKLTPTEEQFDQIVKAWEKEQEIDGLSTYNDYGFQFSDHQSPRWLGKTYARSSFEIPVTYIDDVLIEPDSLLSELIKRKATITKLIVK